LYSWCSLQERTDLAACPNRYEQSFAEKDDCLQFYRTRIRGHRQRQDEADRKTGTDISMGRTTRVFIPIPKYV
jgi:hypothetical protein